MKHNNKESTANITIVLTIVVSLLTYLLYEYITANTDEYKPNKECAYIGRITIGADSLKAINLIKDRMLHSSKGDITPTIVTNGDSTGYHYPKYNESYYIAIDSGKVSRIYFHSDSLSDKEIKIIAKGNRFCKHKLISYNGKTWTAYQDGKGTYIIYKNK